MENEYNHTPNHSEGAGPEPEGTAQGTSVEHTETAGQQNLYTDPNAGFQQPVSPETQNTEAVPPQNTGSEQQSAQPQSTYSGPSTTSSQTQHGGQQQTNTGYQQTGYQNGSTGYQQNYQQNTGYTQQGTRQDNYAYNVGNNTGYNNSYEPQQNDKPMSMGDWLLTLLILIVPCGFIAYFVWAFSKTGNINRRNYCRAALIMAGIGIVIYLIFFLIFGAALLGGYNYY